jgi:hypothetical protein
MKAYGIKRDFNDLDDYLNASRYTSRHGARNAASKRAYRRHVKRRARQEDKAACRED